MSFLEFAYFVAVFLSLSTLIIHQFLLFSIRIMLPVAFLFTNPTYYILYLVLPSYTVPLLLDLVWPAPTPWECAEKAEKIETYQWTWLTLTWNIPSSFSSFLFLSSYHLRFSLFSFHFSLAIFHHTIFFISIYCILLYQFFMLPLQSEG